MAELRASRSFKRACLLSLGLSAIQARTVALWFKVAAVAIQASRPRHPFQSHIYSSSQAWAASPAILPCWHLSGARTVLFSVATVPFALARAAYTLGPGLPVGTSYSFPNYISLQPWHGASRQTERTHRYSPCSTCHSLTKLLTVSCACRRVSLGDEQRPESSFQHNFIAIPTTKSPIMGIITIS